MRQILLFILMLFASVASAQQQNITVDSIAIGRKPTSKINLDGSITAKNFNGKRPITGSVATGQNPNTNDLVAWLNSVFYPSQAPVATLTGGITYEMSSPSIPSVTNLSWSYGRQLATENISTVTINQGVGSVFTTQPSAGGYVNGTIPVTVTPNNNTTFTLTVTTIDGKTATASTSVSFLPKKFWGRTSKTAADINDLFNSSGGGTQLSANKSGTYNIMASGSNRVFVAYPTTLGDLTSINIGGLESIEAFSKTVISYTSVNGYTQNYNVYTSNNETGGNVTAVIQ